MQNNAFKTFNLVKKLKVIILALDQKQGIAIMGFP
jgi:hypothetical protein